MEIALVYIVAGLCSRFGGKIKSFVKITDKETLIEYSLKQALPAGFTKIIFVVGKHTEQPFKEKFGNNYKGIPVFYAFQEFDSKKRDKPWGTCDALCSANHLIKEPFVILVGDELYGEKSFKILINHLKTGNENVTVVKKLIDMLPEKGTVNRGIFEIDKDCYVKDCTENLGINKENFKERRFEEDSPTSISIFGLHTKTLDLLNEKLEKFKEENKNNRNAECYLNIKLAELIKQEKIKMKLYYTPDKWYGITNSGDELTIQKQLKLIKKQK